MTYPAHIRVWAQSPPMAPVRVTPHIVNVFGPVYLGDSAELVRRGHVEMGIHVATSAQKDEIDALNGGN